MNILSNGLYVLGGGRCQKCDTSVVTVCMWSFVILCRYCILSVKTVLRPFRVTIVLLPRTKESTKGTALSFSNGCYPGVALLGDHLSFLSCFAVSQFL